MVRDVSGSYRRALSETVHHYGGWRPEPASIDALKGEGRWNNDWEASMELLRRGGHSPLPAFDALVTVFSAFYFGGDPEADPASWRGFIGSEPLLVSRGFFEAFTDQGIAWGFVSGAEPASARYVLNQRLGLIAPALIAMGDAPDKPDPSGLLRLAEALAGQSLGPQAPPIAYLGDTVADVMTVQRARQAQPQQRWHSLAVAPPHLHAGEHLEGRQAYEQGLLAAGADRLLSHTASLTPALLLDWLEEGP